MSRKSGTLTRTCPVLPVLRHLSDVTLRRQRGHMRDTTELGYNLRVTSQVAGWLILAPGSGFIISVAKILGKAI
jgi:hypothetical protein